MGFGNIAKIHTKYLSKNKIPWKWYDPSNTGPAELRSDLSDIHSFDRVIISSPENKHYDNYKYIRSLDYQGYILVEKPIAIEYEHLLEMTDDKRVIAGMVERFNPVLTTLKYSIDVNKIINIDFSRCCGDKNSNICTMIDIGIHDIDLLFYITQKQNIEQPSILKQNNTFIFTSSNPLCRMIWSKDTFFKERKIIIRQSDCTYEADLQEQSVIKHWHNNGEHVSKSLFVEKSSSIENEHRNFFSNNPDYIDVRKSHLLLLEMIKHI
jgi:hypothetical protein